MQSLYRRYPIGSLLVWVTKSESAAARGANTLAPGVVKLLLDGQQRITSLYGIIRGKPPQFFDGNTQAFTGLYFHLQDEIFEFYMPSKMKGNPLWVNVTELMQTGVGKFIGGCTRSRSWRPGWIRIFNASLL
ncbi:MAG: GmrSD restriction endonuclease domain-containing protein [bacterium]